MHPDSHPVTVVPDSHPVLDAAQPAAQEVPAAQQAPALPAQEQLPVQEQLQGQASSSSLPAPADEAPSTSEQRPGSGGATCGAGRSSSQSHTEREQLLLQAVDEVEVIARVAPLKVHHMQAGSCFATFCSSP